MNYVSDHRACCDAIGKLGKCQLGSVGNHSCSASAKELSSKSFLRVLRVCSLEKPITHKLPAFQQQLHKKKEGSDIIAKLKDINKLNFLKRKHNGWNKPSLFPRLDSLVSRSSCLESFTRKQNSVPWQFVTVLRSSKQCKKNDYDHATSMGCILGQREVWVQTHQKSRASESLTIHQGRCLTSWSTQACGSTLAQSKTSASPCASFMPRNKIGSRSIICI